MDLMTEEARARTGALEDYQTPFARPMPGLRRDDERPRETAFPQGRNYNGRVPGSRIKAETLHDLKPGCCKWPVNNPAKGEGFLFCAHPQEAPNDEKNPWCEYHAARAWVRRPR